MEIEIIKRVAPDGMIYFSVIINGLTDKVFHDKISAIEYAELVEKNYKEGKLQDEVIYSKTI